ncbi:Calcineurin-like phosphoesterase [Phytophthora megakarya]|uniref:Calcineurin-like phosphoesterase n=1 Tax=Phytophthora megakarya TaxID=4795 RepID=A0A225WHF4_9STRA|nr:Calcineurin-like phosphoesterase [Phytophthora megakarya]
MQTIVNPSSNVFVCGEYVAASTAFNTQQYVVDLMTTTEDVYMSVRYPVRPIVAVELLSGVSTDTSYSACEELEPQGEWETPGFVLKSSEGATSNSDSSDVVVCVQRPLANATGSFSVLTDLTVVLPSASCPNATESANSTEVTSDQIKLCAEWGVVDFGNDSNTSSLASSDATSSFVAELALYETSTDEASDVNISSTIPGNWSVIDSIRDSLLAAASTIAQQLKEESNVSSSTSAGEASDPMYNECREAVTVAFLDELLDLEQPDFVVFTGDNVQPDLDTAMHTFAMSIFTARVESRGIPWSAVFGNHDTEGGLTREEMLELMVEGKQYSHVKYGPRDIGGVGNYEVNVVAPTDGPWGEQGSTVFRMYFLDSHNSIDTATYPLVNDDSDYDWIKESQISFYRELAQSHIASSDSNSSQNGSVPAVMYYHIPIPEYSLASPLNRIGDKNEATASAAVNSGLFSALVEMGDVKATFVGHDHINEYCYLRQDIQLCYGGGIGLGRAYGLTEFARRARVLEWTYNTNQTRSLRSWKRHLDDPTQIQSLEVLYSE